MKITTKKRAIISAILSLIVLGIGLALIPTIAIWSVVIIALAVLNFAYAVYAFVKIVIAEREYDEYDEYEEEEDEYEEEAEYGKDENKTKVSPEKKGFRFDVLMSVSLLLIVFLLIVIIFRGCSGRSIAYVDKIEVPNIVVTNALTTPELDVDKEIDTPKINVSEEITTPKIDVDKEIDAPKINVSEEIATPKIDVDKEIDAPKINVSEEITTPKIDVDKEIDTPKINVSEEITTPKIDVEKEITTPEINVTDKIVTPEITTGNVNGACQVTKPIETPKCETPKVETPKPEVPVHVCEVVKSDNKPATCTENGYVHKICSCGKILCDETITATGHKWDNGKVTKKATEYTTGVMTYTCRNCGETTTEKIDKLEHECSVCEVIEKEATCTKAGYIREVCSCGAIISEDTIKAIGHKWDNGKVTKKATEYTTGVMTYTCKNCGETTTEKIDKLEHECEVCDVIEKEATCTKAGYIRKVCSCGEIISEKTVKATGHDYEIASEKEPTATVDGYTKYRCSNCGDTYKDVIPATGEVEEPVDDEFVITVNKMKVVGNEFDAIEVYTSGNANDLVVLQNQKVFNYTVKDSHHLILTVGDVDTFAKVRIYDPAHEDKVVEVRRLSPVDPMA